MKIKKSENGWTTINPAAYLQSKVRIQERDDKYYVTTPSGKYIMYPHGLKLVFETGSPKDYNKDGRTAFSVWGESKENCEEWVKRNCASPDDLRMKHNDLLKLISIAGEELDFDNPFKYKEYEVISNQLVYEGNEHNDCRLVFKKGDKYYSFEYMYVLWGSNNPRIGKYNSNKNMIDKTTYLCRNVQRKEKRVTVVTYET